MSDAYLVIVLGIGFILGLIVWGIIFNMGKMPEVCKNCKLWQKEVEDED